MLYFIVRRVLWIIPVILLATFLTFLLVKQLPPPFEGNRKLSPAVRANLQRQFGYKDPWYEQYGNYLGHLASGDLGISTKSGNAHVADVIKDTLPASAMLGLLTFIVALSFGILTGVISAIWANRWPDISILVVTTILFALPTFLTLRYAVEYLPYWTIGWDTTKSMVAPVALFALAIMPFFTRVVRAAMLESLQSEYVVMARSKGLPWRQTVIRHVVRNSMIPTVVNAAPILGGLITGSFIIERICLIPGVADQFLQAFAQPIDLNMIMATTILLSVLIIIANVASDLLVAWLDPRITND